MPLSRDRAISVRGWPLFVVRFDNPKLPLGIRELRKWCRDNIRGDYVLDEFKKDRVFSIGKVSVAGLIRCQDIEDQLLVKLKWYSYQ